MRDAAAPCSPLRATPPGSEGLPEPVVGSACGHSPGCPPAIREGLRHQAYSGLSARIKSGLLTRRVKTWMAAGGTCGLPNNGSRPRRGRTPAKERLVIALRAIPPYSETFKVKVSEKSEELNVQSMPENEKCSRITKPATSNQQLHSGLFHLFPDCAPPAVQSDGP